VSRFLDIISLSSVSTLTIAVIGGIVACAIIAFFIYLHMKSRVNPFGRAEHHIERGSLDRAMVLLALELDKNPGNRQALLMRADIEAEQGRYVEALEGYFRLIGLKKPGDGIDTMEVKRKLLKPLHELQSLFELHSLCMDILKTIPSDPDALYYMALIYTGQLYYKEAEKILLRLISTAPPNHDVLFLYGVVLIQNGRYGDGADYLQRARTVSESLLSGLVHGAALYLSGDYKGALAVVNGLPDLKDKYERSSQYFFMLRLGAFCCHMLERYDEAHERFDVLYKIAVSGETVREEPVGIGLYNELGKLRGSGGKEKRVGMSTVFSEYYRLKEVAVEEGRLSMMKVRPSQPRNRILDIEGLSLETSAALDLALSDIKSGKLREAADLMKRVRKEHPEVLGLKRLIDRIEERAGAAGDGRSGEKDEKRRFGLEEYIEEWEKYGIRTHQIMYIARLAAGKQLSPALLFGPQGQFGLDE